MKLFGKIFGYFYTLVLSLWIIALPQYDFFLPEGQTTKLEVFSEEAGSVGYEDNFYLLSHNNHLYAGNFQDKSHTETEFFCDGYPYPDLYWKNSRSTALSFLVADIVYFKATDIVFPFHSFW